VPGLTVWRYDTPSGADAGEVRLKALEQRGGLTLHDAVVVSWFPGEDTPRIGHVHHRTASAAGKSSLLGGLIGTLVLAPVAGMAVGAAAGAAAQKLRGTGVDRSFLEEVTRAITPGTSALVVLSSDAVVDQVRPVLERGDAVLIHAELDPEAAAALADVLPDVAGTEDDGTS
jgi:uncharacterized membrane protein